jgi:hypothetical protein
LIEGISSSRLYDYRLPFFHDLKGVGGAVLSGWEVSGITLLPSRCSIHRKLPTPRLESARADYVGGDVLLADPGPNGWINPKAFAPAPAGRRGNSGAGIVLGPNLQTWDFSMRKQFTVTERFNIRVSADMFNAFNHANFRGPATVLN